MKAKIMKIRRYPGFTRVELSTAISILMLMMVPLLPAVQRVREDARQAQCRLHLKQLGLAAHNYHDVYQLFPVSWISKRMEGEGHPSNGWQAAILPFIDQAPLYNELYMSSHVYENNKQNLLKTEIAIYRCPADSLPAENSMRGGWGSSSYAGCYGANPIPRWNDSYSTNVNWPGQVRFDNPYRREKNDVLAMGIFLGANQKCRISDIRDGTSNVILIAEKSVLSGGGIWPGPRSNFHESDVLADGSYASPINQSETGFSSRHPGIFQILTADGAVHPVTTSIESLPFDPQRKQMGILQKLAARNDGSPVDRSGLGF